MSERFFNREVVIVSIVAAILVAVSIMPPWNPLTAEDPDPAQVRRQADDAFASERWKDASERYKRLVELDEMAADGIVWFRLGYALHAQGRLDEALKAHQRATSFTRFAPTARYNIACAFALKGDKEKALKALKGAIEMGFHSPRPIEMDSDFASIKDDPRFKALAIKSRPPVDMEDYRRFDFWVGEWKVVTPGGKQVGTNKIQKRERGFALVENWTSASGGTGVSLNYYDPLEKKWKQTWVDASGNIIRYVGQWREGKMQFEGHMATIKGEKTLSRMTIEPLSDGRVHQKIVRSFDDGKTWSTYFDGHYERIAEADSSQANPDSSDADDSNETNPADSTNPDSSKADKTKIEVDTIEA